LSIPVRTARNRRLLVCASTALGLWAALLAAQPVRAADEPTIDELGRLSLEELSDIPISSVSKREEPLSQAPAAIFVITREDIRRSGAGTLPEALRLAPNVDVARIGSAAYTISARGFNSPEAGNKLLVLIDGRSVYTPLASTVFWESLDIVLADVERIEVISGPGGTLWGANAVNGVINIITRNANATQGLLAEGGLGDHERQLSVRYGGRLGDNAAIRIFGQARNADLGGSGLTSTSAPFDALNAGFRADGTWGTSSYTVQGDIYRNTLEYLDQTLTGGNLLGRWRRELGNASSLEVQAYYDEARRKYAVASDALQTFDVQAQHDLPTHGRHDLIWGGEYRVWRSEFDSLVGLGFVEPAATLHLGSLFVQDDVELAPPLKLTLGMKLEYNSYSGLDYLPTARLAWQANDRTLFWTGVSRAVRTPSRIDRELSGGGFLGPSPDFDPETLIAFEAGYRGRPTANLSLSVSAFYNVYDKLRTSELTNGGVPLVLANGLGGHTYGIEAWATYAVAPWWQLSAGAATLEKDLEVDPGHVDLSGLQAAGQDPSYRAQLRSRMNLGDRMELDVGLRSVGRVSVSNVPAYVEAEARFGWRLTDTVELSLAGFNLLHEDHLESSDPPNNPATLIPRGIFLTLRWEG
jgi:iron complex outermembrane receptor protein